MKADERQTRLGRIAVREPPGDAVVGLLVTLGVVVCLASLILLPLTRNCTGSGGMLLDTQCDINAIAMALESYKADFGSYPPIYFRSGTWPDGKVKATPSAIERNEMLRAYLTLRVKLGTKTFGPWLPEESAKRVKDSNRNGKLEFVDSWDFPLIFNMPGTDHASDVDGEGKPRPGPDNTRGFDLYSYGPNNLDDTGAATPKHDHGDDIGAWAWFRRK